jgi:branched-chain amino acid transport system substrate-binding protein
MPVITRRKTFGLFGAAAALPLARPALAQGAGPLKVGCMLPLSGPASLEGQQIVTGVRFTVDEINAAGGVLGRQIELVVEDDEASPTKGVTLVHKLIERDQVPVIIGTYASAVAQAGARVAREAKVPMISGGSTASSVTQDNPPGDPWFFRPWPGSDAQGDQSAEDIVQRLGKHRISIIHDNTSYGVTLRDQVTKHAKDIGGEVISDDGYNAGEQDFSPVLTRLRTLRPDAVYIAGWLGDGANIVRQASDIGLRSAFVGSGSMMSDQFIKLTGAVAEGFGASTPYDPGTPNVKGKAFGERYQKKMGVPANAFAALSFDSTSCAIEAIRRAGKADGAAIQAVLKSGMKDFPLASGGAGTMANFDAQGGVYFRNFLAIVHNGKFTIGDQA